MIAFHPLSRISLVFSSVLLIGLGGCSSSKSLEKIRSKSSAQELYDAAMKLLKAKKYAKAAEAFDVVESQFPHSDIAAKSQLLAGYCLIKAKKYLLAADGMDLFIEMHPTSPWVKQALYMKALAYELNVKDLKKDPHQAQMALEAYSHFLERFPRDNFSKEAKIKKQFLKEHVASHDMMIARYYLDQSNYVAAWFHYNNMIQDWSDSILIPEVYYRIIECHIAMGLAQYAGPTLQQLRARAPKNPWTKRAVDLLKKSGNLLSSSHQKVANSIVTNPRPFAISSP